jgi:plastocyanin
LLFGGTAVAQTTHTVTVTSNEFTPANLTIEAGDTVLWDNVSGIHNVNGAAASYPSNPEEFGNDLASAPWTYSFTFTTPGTYGYHCDAHGAPGVGMFGAITVEPATTDSPLLISEYVEGSSFNKALEIYNPSGADVDLDAGAYELRVFFNGNTDPGTTVALTGVIPAGDVFVFAEDSADPAILAVANQTFGGALWNGDDAAVLYQGEAVVDVIGQVGFDPGDEWGTGDTSTADNTIRREGDACTPDTDPSDAFDPAVSYTGYPNGTFDGLGSPGNLACGAAAIVVTATANPDTIAPGGTFTVTATVTNNSGSAAPLDAWIVAAFNGNPVLTKRLGSGTLPNGATVTRSFNLRAPGNTPPGVYDLTFNVGDFPASTVLGFDAFQVTVTAERLAHAAAEAGAVFEAQAIPGDLFAAEASAPRALTASPNPAREQTAIRFTLAAGADVRLAVYDALGREVAVLVEGPLAAGAHTAPLDARALPAGVYVYRLTAGGQAAAGRLTVVR